jgi:DNA-binding transcriptional MerR regulator
MPIIENGETYLTVKEACIELNISRQALDGYVKRGLLVKYPRELGRRVFFKQSEIDKLKRIKQPEQGESAA